MFKKLDKQKRMILIIIAAIITIVIIKIIDNNYQTKEEIKIEKTESKQQLIQEEHEEEIIVYITGEVNTQGVIKLKSGSRIADAIEKAGGLTENANIKNINLAYALEDGEKIYIPNLNDPEIITEETKNIDTTININKANSDELQNLNGIGEGLSKSIIEYREENGKFKQIEDLLKVPGIGENKFKQIEPYIKVK